MLLRDTSKENKLTDPEHECPLYYNIKVLVRQTQLKEIKTPKYIKQLGEQIHKA